jgi:hypothetical protein
MLIPTRAKFRSFPRLGNDCLEYPATPSTVTPIGRSEKSFVQISAPIARDLNASRFSLGTSQ